MGAARGLSTSTYCMEKVFVGTEAVASGIVTRHELARWHRPVFPDVHVQRGHELTVHDRARGAWLWSQRRAIVTGVAASAMHGAEWVGPNTAIELVYKHTHAYPPAGIVARNERIACDEITCVGGVPVVTVARAAFDLGRYQARGRAIARLDALMRAAPFA